jgi:hypothetical protein
VSRRRYRDAAKALNDAVANLELTGPLNDCLKSDGIRRFHGGHERYLLRPESSHLEFSVQRRSRAIVAGAICGRRLWPVGRQAIQNANHLEFPAIAGHFDRVPHDAAGGCFMRLRLG